MQIYFARSIRGKHNAGDKVFFQAILDTIKQCGHVPALETKPIEDPDGIDKNVYIYQRDIEWIDNSQAMIAEVSNPSLGVGYEIAYAHRVRHIPVLAVAQKGVNVSAMIQGALPMVFYDYKSELELHVKVFLEGVARDTETIDLDAFAKVCAERGSHEIYFINGAAQCRQCGVRLPASADR